jgi:serine/threonine protein kinase/WD40 repeat protein
MNEGIAESAHPSMETLRTFGSGQLDEAEATVVEEHISRCEPCGRTLAAIHSDSFIHLLRRAHREAAEKDESLASPQAQMISATPAVADSALTSADVTAERQAVVWVEHTDQPIVPGYQILEVLGRGGMGVVYKARQVGLNRLVALKMILGGAHSSPEAMVRFLAEAEAVAHLQHTNIVQIYQVGRHGEVPFFSLEYVDGGTLAQRLDGELPLPHEAARLVECLAQAMHLAHQGGIVHRDLKPANVLLASGGRGGEVTSPLPPPLAGCTPKITDFGLAKRVECGVGLTQTGAILGTPGYMAPEQAEGKKNVGPAADIYALGAILYEMLTGRPPFRAPTPLDTIMQVLSEEPVAPMRLQSGCPRDLETICLKCLHKEPGKRYATAEDLADDLQRFLTDRPIRARRTSMLERLRRWRRRNPVMAGMMATVATLLVLLAAGASVAAVVFSRQHAEAVANLKRAVEAEEAGQEKLWQELVARARAGRFSQRIGQRFASLDAIAQAVRMARERHMPPERLDLLRNEAVACLALPDMRLREWDGWPEGSVGLDYNAERGVYARTDQQGNVSVRRLDDDTELAHLAGEGIKVQPHFSPDGRILLLRELEGKHRIRVWDPGSNKMLVLVPETAGVTEVQVAPDNTHFAVGHKDGSVHLYELLSGRRTVLPGKGKLESVRFSPGGRWLGICRSDLLMLHDLPAGRSRALELGMHFSELVFGPGDRLLAVLPDYYSFTERRFVRIFDLDTGGLTARLEHPESVCSVAWHPDGKQLATGTFHNDFLTLWDVPTHTRLQVLTGHKGGALEVHFNATGDLLLSFSSWGRGARLWHPQTGKLLLVSPQARFGQVRAAPDGRLLALETAGHKLRLWEAHAAPAYRTLVAARHGSGATTYNRVAVHPAGRLAAVATSEGLSLWELATGQEIQRFATGITQGLYFDQNGTLAATSQQGVWRLPVRPDPAGSGSVQVGPRQTFLPPSGRNHVAGSRDGTLLVVAHPSSTGVNVLYPEEPRRSRWLGPHLDVRCVAMTADGRLTATSSHGTDKQFMVKVWNTTTHDLVKGISLPGICSAGFSPDGRWLAVASEGKTHLFDVATWREVRQIEGNGITFTPDSRLLAVEREDAILRLHEVSSGREVVCLDNPRQIRSSNPIFSPDGSRLLFVSQDLPGFHVWELGSLRRELAKIGLDWSPDPLPPPQPRTARPQTVRVESIPGEAPVVEPPVVVLPATRRRAAGPENIATWIKQLADADARVRQTAADALAEVGASAVKALSMIAQGPPSPWQKQAHVILDRITVAAAIAPTRVRLRLKDASLADALYALAEQTGIAVKYEPPPGKKPRALNLVLEDVPAWEALDRICEAAGAHLNVVGVFGLSVSHRTPTAPEVHGYAGPFRLQRIGSSYERYARADGAGERLNMQFRLLKDPRARSVVAGSRFRLTEAQSDDGQSLLLRGGSDFPLGSFEAGGVQQISADLALKPIDRRGGKLRVLKGVLPLEVMVRKWPRVIVPDLARSQGRTFFGSQGRRLTVMEAKPFGNQWNLVVRVAGAPGYWYDPKHCGLELVDARGRTVPLRMSFSGAVLLRSPPPEDTAWLAASPLTPGLGAVPWTAFAARTRRPRVGGWQGAGWAKSAERLEAPIRLRFFDGEYRRTELPFELHDIPLP